MSRLIRKIQDQVFEIDVKPLPVSLFDEPLQMFVAHVCKVSGADTTSGEARIERHEIYGPTEEWAVRNACDCIASQLKSDARS